MPFCNLFSKSLHNIPNLIVVLKCREIDFITFLLMMIKRHHSKVDSFLKITMDPHGIRCTIEINKILMTNREFIVSFK